MKKQVIDCIHSLGGTAMYSGHTRTMYITDPRKDEVIESIEACILNKFGYGLPFRLVTV